MKAVSELMKELTLDEKITLLAGKGLWNSREIERLGIPSVTITDGPVGVRKQEGMQDNLGLSQSVKASCFPSGASVACSWDRNLIRKMGEALGEEAQALQVGVLLGPAMNIKRTPLGGRNFEYFSEDPYLTGEMATAYVKGVQSKGIATSLKHFAANNQEYRRRSMNVVIDERALREIYLRGFEKAVKESEPASVMASYNRLNGTYACENGYLLNDVLRKEWGFDGVVVSDWDAVNDHSLGLKNGLDLRMPCLSDKDARDLRKAYDEGKISMEEIDGAVKRNLTMIKKVVESQSNMPYDPEEHHKLIRRIASESIVLLKNEGHILPLSGKEKILVAGDMAENLRYQGGGSSHVAPYKCDRFLEELQSNIPNAEITFAKGYSLDEEKTNEVLFKEAIDAADKADIVLVFAGLPEELESEGYDREHMHLPEVQNELITALAAIKPVVVVLANGGAVTMPWNERVNAVLESYLGGEAAAGAIADVLTGKVNPSGKLAESFPVDIRHNPAYLNYPGYQDTCIYHEGVFVGYRYYATKGIRPLYPFGHGLSYTTFAYTDMTIDRTNMMDDESAVLSVTVKNTGEVKGKEIVQIYIHDDESTMPKPEIELKHFEKIELEPGEEKVVRFLLNADDFAHYETSEECFAVESGSFTIYAGTSSENLLLHKQLTVTTRNPRKPVYTEYSTFGDVMKDTRARKLLVDVVMRDPYYNMVFSGNFQNADPEKILGYNLLKELGDTDTIGEEALQKLLEDMNS